MARVCLCRSAGFQTRYLTTPGRLVGETGLGEYMAAPMPAVVVLIVCRAILGEPDDNSKFTHYVPTEWDLAGGVMHCRRLEVALYDPAVDQGADPQAFNTWHCMKAGARFGSQYDIDNWNKPWRFYRFGCPVPIMDDNGTPENVRDDKLVGWHTPECGDVTKDKAICEQDTEI